MDLSQAFVEHVRRNHPDMRADVGDLTRGIGQPDGAFDGVICLRSLSGIGRLDSVLPEMIRVLRPGGVMIVDYGRNPYTVSGGGGSFVVDGEDIDGQLRSLLAHYWKVGYESWDPDTPLAMLRNEDIRWDSLEAATLAITIESNLPLARDLNTGTDDVRLALGAEATYASLLAHVEVCAS